MSVICINRHDIHSIKSSMNDNTKPIFLAFLEAIPIIRHTAAMNQRAKIIKIIARIKNKCKFALKPKSQKARLMPKLKGLLMGIGSCTEDIVKLYVLEK